MKPVPFDYHRPQTVAEAVALLFEKREDAAVLAGGMTLGPMLNLRMVRPRAVIDISRIKALKTISVSSAVVATGAGVVQSDALRSDVIGREVPLLALALPWVGHFQTRNRGTLGGSVAHADPSAEIPLCLVVCGGTVVLQSRRRERRVPACEFFVGALTTQRRSDEIVTALEWPRCAPDAGHAFTEIAQRHGDFAIAAAGCSLRLGGDDRIEELSLGVGGVESRPVAIDARSFLGRPGGEIAAGLAEHAAACVTPMEDHSASADYRAALSKVLVERAVGDALEMARERRGRLQ
ncbi:MAG: FAD binding domain-containing protein [Xanthobacteraceae bacterium]